MESQPQNPEIRSNPENFHPWIDRVHLLENFLTVSANVKVSEMLEHTDGWTESLESMSKIGSGEQKITQHAKH